MYKYPWLHLTVSQVEVDDVLGVGSLHADGEWLEGVEGEGHESARGRGRVPTHHTRVDLELQEARISRIEPDGRERLKSVTWFAFCVKQSKL